MLNQLKLAESIVEDSRILAQALPKFGKTHDSLQQTTNLDDNAFSFCHSEGVSQEFEETKLHRQTHPTGRQLEWERGLQKLDRAVHNRNAELASETFTVPILIIKTIKTESRGRRTFNNIQIENIARERIIPYINEMFLNQTSSTSESSSRCKSPALTPRGSLKRSRRFDQSADKKKRQFRCNIKIEKIGRMFLLRKGFNVLLSTLNIEYIRQINHMEISQSSLSSLMGDVNRATTCRWRMLQVKIIVKYARKALLSQAFYKILSRYAAVKLEKASKAVTKLNQYLLRQALHQIILASRRSKSCLQLSHILEFKLASNQTRKLMETFSKLRNSVGLLIKCQSRVVKGISIIGQFAIKKRIKLLFSVFLRLCERPSRQKESTLSHSTLPRHYHQEKTKHFFSSVSSYIHGRMRLTTTTCEQASSFINDFLNTSVVEHLQSRVSIDQKEGIMQKRHLHEQEFVIEQPFVEIGSSLPFGALRQDEPIMNIRKTNIYRPAHVSKPLKPLPQDLNIQLIIDCQPGFKLKSIIREAVFRRPL